MVLLIPLTPQRVASWWHLSSSPLVKFSVVASLTMLDVPHEKMEDSGGGGGSSQLIHLLCSASHGSWALAPIPRLRALVAIGPSPWQLPHVPQSGALHWSHSPHRSNAGCSWRFWGRLGPGIKGLCPGSSRSFFLSLLSIFAILAYSFHLTLFALHTFLGASPSAIFPAL